MFSCPSRPSSGSGGEVREPGQVFHPASVRSILMAVNFISQVKRTHSCGELTRADIGKTVGLFGWDQNRRDHGGAVFIDLRDREGLNQIVFEPAIATEAHDLAGSLRLVSVIGTRRTHASRGWNLTPKLLPGA